MQSDFVSEFSYSPTQVADGASPCSAYMSAVGAPSTSACFGVKGGDVVAEAISTLLDKSVFRTVIASMDDHPVDHCSFAVKSGEAPPSTDIGATCHAQLTTCDRQAFHGCRGTDYLVGLAPDHNLTHGTFPPHCVRGKAGSTLYAPVQEALSRYGGVKHIAIKGLDSSTDSFGVLPYTSTSFDTYKRAGLLNTTLSERIPAVLIRSMLTWEKHMGTSTGGSSYIYPFPE